MKRKVAQFISLPIQKTFPKFGSNELRATWLHICFIHGTQRYPLKPATVYGFGALRSCPSCGDSVFPQLFCRHFNSENRYSIQTQLLLEVEKTAAIGIGRGQNWFAIVACPLVLLGYTTFSRITDLFDCDSIHACGSNIALR